MANKITTLLDLDTKAFQNGVKDFRKAIADADTLTGKFKAGWKGAMDGLRSHSKEAAAGAGLAFGAFASKAIGEASELNESINAVNVTFGNSAQSVLKLGENSAESFGLAKSEFNQLAVQFSAFAKSIAGSSGQDVSTVLGDLTTRVADFASVMNLDLAEATQVFMSTMAGETEPIRRFGKDISAAAVEQYALANGLIKSKSEMTEAIKVQARYGLLMEQTSDTAGDFANTSGELANSQRILAAQAKDLAADIGEDLAPALLTVVKGLQAIIDTAEKVHLDDVLDMGWVETTGTAIGHFFGDLIHGTHDARKANEEYVKSVEAAEQAAAEFDTTQLDGLKTFTEVHQRVLDLGYAVETANLVALEWNKTIGAQDAAIAEVRDEAGAYAALLEGKGLAAIEAINDATERSRKAHELLADAVNDTTDAIFDSLDSQYDYEKSVRDTIASVEALREAEGDNRDEMIASAEAAYAQSKSFAASKGAIEGSTTAALLQRDELQRLKAIFPELKDEIDLYIAKLNQIPGVKSTQLVITTSGKVTTKQTTNSSGRLIAGADGGIVNRPTMALIGEAGPEAVVPLDRSPGNSPLPSGLGGGGGQYTINVYPQSGDVAPEAIVRAIKQFERFNGSGWRS